MTRSRHDVGRKTSRRGLRFEIPRLVQSGALSVLTLALAVEVASAFVPSPEHAALEIPLPFQQGNLVYGDEVVSLAIPAVGAAMSEKIGGRWSVHSWNRQSQSPHYVLGSGADVAPAISNPLQAESAARYVLEQTSMDIGLDPEQLRLDRVAEGAGKYAVHFQQTYEGLDVLKGRAHATFLDTGRVFAMGVDFYVVEGLDVVPAITQAEAEGIAIDDLPHQDRVISPVAGEETGLYILPYPTSIETVEPRLIWRVTVDTDGRTGLWVTHIDAATGEILWRYNDVHYIDYVGSIGGDVQNTTWCNGTTLQPMKYMEVSVEEGGGTSYSNINGNWTIPNDDADVRAVSTRFFGPYVDVNRATGGSDPFTSGIAVPGVPEVLTWTDSNSRRDERDIFDAVSDMHDFFESLDPGYAYANVRITANVGVPGNCNAFWNGSINFYNAGTGCGGAGCSNTGEIQGIVHHEYGHGVQNHLIGGQGSEGCGEGNADVLANFMTDESIIGRGFCLNNCSGGIRNSSNNLQYPESMTGEEHDDGRIIAGVMWNARVNLQNSLGSAAGEAHAAAIWHFGRKLERPTNQPDQCLSMFIADDDNGNVLDGTPNFDAICEAVLAHDADGDAFDCPEAGSVWVDFSNTGSENGSQAHPYNSLFQAHGAASVGYIIKARPGASSESGTLSKRGEIRALGGAVRVGAP